MYFKVHENDDSQTREYIEMLQQRLREFKAIKPHVLKRDNYTCQRCGQPRKYRYDLHVHHMNRNDDVRINSMDNLVTLCTFCHGLVDSARRSARRRRPTLFPL
jgi:5-methylcytosine-specific restriction endonuclease McrA